MCTLTLGTQNSSEPMNVPIPCEYQRVALTFIENISKRASWPRTEITRLELWPDRPPLILRLDNIWMMTVEWCADYAAYQRAEAARREEDELVSGSEVPSTTEKR